MIEKIVRFVLKVPAFAILLALVLTGLGSYSYSELNIEAYPNPVPPLVEIIAQPPGWSAEETERYVTVPLEVGLAVGVGCRDVSKRRAPRPEVGPLAVDGGERYVYH